MEATKARARRDAIPLLQDRFEREAILLRIHPDVTGLTNLGRSTIYQEIAAGRLRVVKIGRAVRVRRDDLDDWLDQRTSDDPQPTRATA